MAQALRQLGLYEGEVPTTAPAGTPQSLLDPLRGRQLPQVHRRLCAGCRAKEARYGFRPEGEATRRSIALARCASSASAWRSHAVNWCRERMARGWNAQQAGLPLQDTLRALDTRRRRAQIAARHALDAPAWPKAGARWRTT